MFLFWDNFIPPFVSCVALVCSLLLCLGSLKLFLELSLSIFYPTIPQSLTSVQYFIHHRGELGYHIFYESKRWKFLTTHLNFPVEIGQKSDPWYFHAFFFFNLILGIFILLPCVFILNWTSYMVGFVTDCFYFFNIHILKFYTPMGW